MIADSGNSHKKKKKQYLLLREENICPISCQLRGELTRPAEVLRHNVANRGKHGDPSLRVLRFSAQGFVRKGLLKGLGVWDHGISFRFLVSITS